MRKAARLGAREQMSSEAEVAAVAALIATGLTRDQALEAMIDPESLRAPRPR